MVEEDDSLDKELDKRKLKFLKEENCVLGSRLAIWMLEEADLKVYLYKVAERASDLKEKVEI